MRKGTVKVKHPVYRNMNIYIHFYAKHNTNKNNIFCK